ncbi:hypothetical protein SC171_05560 [Pantoea cypripedii]|uniref:hypothetical protein n=1 Tax=Pantoea cypripedii TaxID=55209 RepID=UPI002FCC31D0
MDDLITNVIKYAPAVASLIVAVLALWQKWIIKTDRLFEKYSKLSNFAFDLSQKTGDKKLEEISKEYGYAAITGEKSLTHEERRILLKMVNPVSGIEKYHSCAAYLKINVVEGCFAWRKKRHRSRAYRGLLVVLFGVVYFIGSFMVFSPFFYPALQHTFIGEAFSGFSLAKKIGFVAFILIYGLIFFVVGINKVSRVVLSMGLIKSSQTQKVAN